MDASDQIHFHTKLEVAEHQLNAAIELFIDRQDYISSITLAGAAEEILGKMLADTGVKPMVHEYAESSVKVGKILFNEEWSPKHFIDLMNGIRNGLKHFSDGSDVPISRDAATQMLDRAITNYWKLRGEQTPQMQRFMDEIHG